MLEEPVSRCYRQGLIYIDVVGDRLCYFSPSDRRQAPSDLDLLETWNRDERASEREGSLVFTIDFSSGRSNQLTGQSVLSFTHASAAVNCQSALLWCLLR
jgi:hypothetical protein